MESIFEIFAGTDLAHKTGQGRRTGKPIRRQSRERGRCEAGFYRPFNPKTVGQFMLAAERYERTTLQKGKRGGALGHIALEVLRELTRLIDYKTGRLDPSIATLQRRVRRCRASVVKALGALRAHGFLDWLRRFETTDRAGLPLPQVKQATNAYRLSMPAVAVRLLGWLGVPQPVPDDFEHQQQTEKRASDEMEFDDSPLGALFARWGKSIKERESAQQTESSTNKYIRYGAA